MFDKEYYSKVPDRVLAAMKAAGADSAACTLTLKDQIETNCLGHAEYLLREFQDIAISVRVYCDGRRADMKINQFDEESLASFAARAVAIAGLQPERDEKPDLGVDYSAGMMPDAYIERPAPEKLYARFEEMMDTFRAEYPDLNMDGMAWHERDIMFFKNTDGEEQAYDWCDMECGWQVAATDHIDSTTDCVSYFTPVEDMETPFLNLGMMRNKLELARRMLHPQRISGGKFVGTLVFQPDICMAYVGQLMNRMEAYKEDDCLPYPDCSEGFSVYCVCSDEKFHQDSPMPNSENAVKEYKILNGQPNRAEMGESEERVAAGAQRAEKLPYTMVGIEYDKEQPYAQLIKNVKRGILVGHIQGSWPAPNGDFSGAAKNSFYIEDGEIKFPVVECMVSANVFELFKQVRGVSSEKFFLRDSRLPYIAVDGATII